ncbi:MAG TPA: PQQ-binding-like beta-propeller repeat protein [Actinomycetota bacterium]|nr:PQQ-binding-like beta-propeller repeat protein [Actinomycetota bacterium]
MTRLDRLRERRRSRRGSFVAVVLVLVAVAGAIGAYRAGLFEGGDPPPGAGPSPARSPSPAVPAPEPAGDPTPEPINTAVAGLTTFRGNATRTYYGAGPVPRDPEILWRFPSSGGLCSESTDEEGTKTWCGTGWTGQPNVIDPEDGPIQVRFGAYDRAVHILNGRTGRPLYEPFVTGDLIKGTVTSDPDGFPLLYTGSRDNNLRILALDRGRRPVELWSLSSDSAPNPVWNNDWDGSPLIIGDYLLEGGENSWFYVVRLHRGYDDDGRVTVDPRIRLLVPGFDDRLFAALGDTEVSIENSVAFHDGVAYFANSGGLVQGWDVSRVLEGRRTARRVFRFWTGEDTDASVVIDEEGFLYVASELERHNPRSAEVGQLLKLDPRRPGDPIVWDIPIPGEGEDGGMWATPGLAGEAVIAATNTGRILAVDRDRGRIAWELQLSPPTWTSPVVVDDVLLVGDCAGVLHAFSLRGDPLAGPPRELWSVQLEGCIESTPAVWRGMVYVGARGGAVYGIGNPR